MGEATRASILAWSTLSGAILGLFVDATAIGFVLILSAAIPAVARWHYRWLTVTIAAVLCAVPLCLAVLGYLEGRLKTV